MLEFIEGYKNFFFKKPRVLPRLATGVFNRALLKRPHLRVAEIATTFICNSQCVMCSCFKFCDNEKENTRMNVSEYAALGKQLDELGCISINITGGEPLVRKDADEIIQALRPNNKIVNLVTNGINLTRDKMRRYKSLGVDSIVVSLESTRAEENDHIRGFKGHFQAVMNVLKWAREEKINFAVSLTLGDFNFNKVYELLQFVKKNSIFLCIAHGGSIGKWADHDSIDLSYKNAQKLLALIKKYKRMKTDFSANLSLRPGCPAILEKIFVTPYADISPCAFNPISFGNLRRESLKSIWTRMIEFYKHNIYSKTLCLRAYDREYIEKYLKPIKNMEQPVDIEKHPAVLKDKIK